MQSETRNLHHYPISAICSTFTIQEESLSFSYNIFFSTCLVPVTFFSSLFLNERKRERERKCVSAITQQQTVDIRQWLVLVGCLRGSSTGVFVSASHNKACLISFSLTISQKRDWPSWGLLVT